MKRLATTFALISLLALAACGGGTLDTGFPPEGATPGPTGEPTGEPNGGGAKTNVDVKDNEFVPKEVTVAAGGTVLWEQSGSAPHNVKADDGSFDSSPGCSGANTGACLGKGDTFERTFDAPGRVPYFCVIHGAAGGIGMSGVVVVGA